MKKVLTALVLGSLMVAGCGQNTKEETLQVVESTVKTEDASETVEETVEIASEASEVVEETSPEIVEAFNEFQAESFTVYGSSVNYTGEQVILYGIITKNEKSQIDLMLNCFHDSIFKESVETDEIIIGELSTDISKAELDSNGNLVKANLLWGDGSEVVYTVKAPEDKVELLEYNIMPLANNKYCKFPTGIALPANTDEIDKHIGFILKFMPNPDAKIADYFTLSGLEDINVLTADGTDMRTLFNAESIIFEDYGEIAVEYGRGEYEDNAPKYAQVEEWVKQCVTLTYKLDGVEYQVPILWNN